MMEVKGLIEGAWARVEHLFLKYYTPGDPLLEVVKLHSMGVARKALECGARLVAEGVSVDMEFVAEAALLHDIGVVMCDAPSIHCHGTHPYICHGVLGRRILENEGMPRHAMVCEHHTGSGLTVEDIKAQNLPLPLRDMTPTTTEERLICYADKFFSKSGDVEREKPFEEVCASMARHGEDSLRRFLELDGIVGMGRENPPRSPQNGKN